jgi:molybdopterin converting factor small subunit
MGKRGKGNDVGLSRDMAQTVNIQVTGYLKFRGLIGNGASLALEPEKATLGDALEVLCSRYGERFESALFDPSTKEIRRSNLVLLNGQPYINLRKRLDTELKDGDEITLSPVLAGG